MPKLIWRRVEHLTRAMAAANEGPRGYMLKPCVLHPEQVTEFPDLEDLPEFLQSRIYEWQEASGEDAENEEDRLGYDYRNDLCTAPGLKAGGWPYWPHCPRPVRCACGAEMSLLLTIPNGERGAQSWTPVEEQHVTTRRPEDPAFYDPTGFRGARDELMVFVCQQDPCHEPFIDIE